MLEPRFIHQNRTLNPFKPLQKAHTSNLYIRVNNHMFVYGGNFFARLKLVLEHIPLLWFDLVVSSLEASKISESCQRTRRLPYKVIF